MTTGGGEATGIYLYYCLGEKFGMISQDFQHILPLTQHSIFRVYHEVNCESIEMLKNGHCSAICTARS
jgi:hypothetical protein